MKKQPTLVILRSTSLNGVCIENDRFMGSVIGQKNAEEMVSLLQDDVKTICFTLNGLTFKFYTKDIN